MPRQTNGEQTRHGPRRLLPALLMLAGLACGVFAMAALGIWPFFGAQDPPPPFEGASVSVSEPVPGPWDNFRPADPDNPADRLFITVERQQYEAGQLRLVIPKLNVDVPVQSDVDMISLQTAPGLFPYAQLPGTGDRNVSIAGHRDIFGKEFYYIHTLAGQDNLYLVYEDVVYRYSYLDTTIVGAEDWGPIYSQGFSCLTLQSCDPIGTDRNRIFVRASLAKMANYSEDFVFEPAAE